MIIMPVMDGLGNQLVQYAFGRYLAHKHNTELKLDITDCINSKNSHHSYYRLGEFNIQENFATAEEIKSVTPINEKGAFDEKLNYTPDKSFWNNYRVDERYFGEIRDILLREFTLKHPLGKNSFTWRKKILAADCAVSLHLRNGDFLTPLLRNTNLGMKDYYSTCINELKKIFGNITLFIFSDDLDFAKKAFNFDVPTNFVEGCEKDAEELYLMSICKHNIIYTGSTFSWWGAWLNQNPDKIVFCPSSSNTPPKYIPQNFTFIPVEKNSKPLIEFPPMLSIIVYVENNLSTINYSLSSIISQNFPDCEIILIDTSTDGSGEICRKVSKIKKLTLLTADSSTSKFAAWNKGLDVARGDYILFLTAKDFMFSDTVKNLAQFHYDYLKRYLEPRGKYLFCDNYGKDYPDIICTTQIVNEDERGTLDLKLPGKKFSVQVDNILKNLNTFVETNFSSEEKLLALKTKSINNYVDTKFFNRQFLNENHLRFNEKEDTELNFVVESFLKTEKIVFMSKPITGRLK